jgi:hypothetical protein
MSMTIAEQMLAQIDDVLEDLAKLAAQARYGDYSDLPGDEAAQILTRLRAVLNRVAGTQSVYVDQADKLIRQYPTALGLQAKQLGGVVRSLRSDIEKGFLKSQRELIHGELFGDFLEMAQHLLNEGYKDAAAVIAGSSLEAHLRQLCQKTGIPTEVLRDSRMVAKKAAVLNTDLREVYAGKIGDEKKIAAWLDLRNHAAHGQYDKYQAGEVGLLIAGVRDFIDRNPA